MWPTKDYEFTFSKMNYFLDQYKFGNIHFSPQFNLVNRDSADKKQATITKEPKIQISFPDSVKEIDLVKYAQLISSVASFYYMKPIDYSFSRIHLKSKTITIKRILNNNAFSDTEFTIFPVYKGFGIDSLFRNLKQSKFTDKSISQINVVVEKFWQSQFVDSRSAVLLKFAIIELLKVDNKVSKEYYELKETIKKKTLLNDVKKRFSEAILNDTEKKEFEDKWNTYLSQKLLSKSMKSPLEEFLRKKGMEPDNFVVSFSEIKKVRDSITHGSTGKYSKEYLDNVNAMLYRICIGLILSELIEGDWREMVEMTPK